MKINKSVDWDISRSISDIIDSRWGECVANTTRAFLDFPELLPLDSVFVEGIYYYGGQYLLHTWVETTDSIIDLSLVHETNPELRDFVRYYPIQLRGKSEIENLYGAAPREPGTRLMMKLSYSDSRVVKLLDEIDAPPEL